MTTSPAGAGRVLVDLLRQGSLALPRADLRRQVAGGRGADADAGLQAMAAAGSAAQLVLPPMSARVR